MNTLNELGLQLGFIPLPLPILLGGLVALASIAVSLVLASWRLFLGPTLPDRVVALDVITILLVAMFVVLSVMSGSDLLLDVAVILALVGFLGTVAFARFTERSGRNYSDRSDQSKRRSEDQN